MNSLNAIVLASIVIPVLLTLVLAWVFLHGMKDDPDEQRWRRLDEQRRAAAQIDSSDSEP